MLKNKIWLGIILSIILLVFNVAGFASYYKYTQESGTLFYVASPDKADALEDTNEVRQIIDDLGNLLVHSKRNDLYPKDETTGGTLAIPNSALVSFATGTKGDLFYCSATNVWTKLNVGTDNQILVVATDIPNWETPSSDLLSDVASIAMLDENEDITGAWTISTGSIEGVDATEFGYLNGVTSDIQTQFGLRYLKTEINTLGKVEAIYTKDIIDSDELAALKFTDLDDTPANYTGSSLKFARVNVGETALEFAEEADPTVDTDAEIKAILVDEVTKIGTFTAGKIAKINNATGIIEMGTNTDTEVADAVTKKHTAGADTTLGTMTADVNMGTHKLTGLSVPSATGQSVRTTATITEANLEDAVSKKHTQNTDTAAGGEWDFGAHSAGFTIQTATGDGTTTINWTLGNYFKFTHGAMAETFTFDPAPTKPSHLTLIIIQDGVGGRDSTLPVPVKWLGAEPTWTDGGAGKGIVMAIVYDGTSYWSQGTPWEE